MIFSETSATSNQPAVVSPQRHRGQDKGAVEFSGDLINSARGRNAPSVLHAAAQAVPPRRGTSPGGAEGVSRPRGRNAPSVLRAAAIMPFCLPCGVVTTLLFALRNDTWVGNPSGPSGHLPCKAEEFSLGRTSGGKQFVSC